VWSVKEEAKRGTVLRKLEKRVCSKKNDGLGIKEITAFSRSLRLRWLWFQWDDSDRPWKGMDVPCDAIDIELFAACTEITIGNGSIVRFWMIIGYLELLLLASLLASSRLLLGRSNLLRMHYIWGGG
jgi:hypothetical protein